MSSDKTELRVKIKDSFTKVDALELYSKSKQLSLNLLSLIKSLNLASDSIMGIYAPLKDEPDWQVGFGEIYDDKFAFAAIENDQMAFYKCRPSECVEKKDFGVTIKGPPKERLNKPISPEVLIIPGLAFDRNGARLGRGKGFYDKYLEKFSGSRIGVCFDFQILDAIPSMAHDQGVDYIVTNQEIIRIRE